MLINRSYQDSERLVELRQLGTWIVNGYQGLERAVNPQDLMKLPLIDNAGIVLPIRTREEAIELIREMLEGDRKSTRLNSSHVKISYAVFCLKKKKKRYKKKN